LATPLKVFYAPSTSLRERQRVLANNKSATLGDIEPVQIHKNLEDAHRRAPIARRHVRGLRVERAPKSRMFGPHSPGVARSGEQTIPIVAAGGEYVIEPEAVARVGGAISVLATMPLITGSRSSAARPSWR
jgi:hypothetical protein